MMVRKQRSETSGWVKSDMEHEVKEEFGITETSHDVIDLVESRVRELYPDIESMASQLEGNTLLHGEDYYDLENEVVKVLSRWKRRI